MRLTPLNMLQLMNGRTLIPGNRLHILQNGQKMENSGRLLAGWIMPTATATWYARVRRLKTTRINLYIF